MSGGSDEHGAVVNSTLTELVLILLFGFMLVSAHFGSRAKSVMDQAAAAVAKKDAEIEKLKERLDNPPPPPPPPEGKIKDPHWPPCWVKQAGVREGVFVLITTKVDGERLTIRINDEYAKYHGDRSALNLSPDFAASLLTPKEYRLDDLYRLVSTLRGTTKGDQKCNVDLSLPKGSQLPGTMHERLSEMVTIGYYTPKQPKP